MNSRTFTDGSGAEWRVRATTPLSRAAAALPSDFSRGWLVFESPSGEVRRLAPIPDGWESAPAGDLEQMCRSATESLLRVDGLTGEVRRYEPGAKSDTGA